MDKYYEKSCEEFTALTLSKNPVPGGGSVAALSGALGASLGGMVASLTKGKKKYAAYEEDIERILMETEKYRQKFFTLMDEDMENFLPLSKAYGLPKETEEEKEERARELDRCLRLAAKAPMEMVQTVSEILPLFEELSVKGSKLAMSDVGCGVSMLRAASDSAWLNVLINLNMIKDPSFTEPIREEYGKMVEETDRKCGEILRKVTESL